MAGVVNNTARQFNIKVKAEGRIVTARIAPGFNVVDDEHWKHCTKDPYVKQLKKLGHINYGKDQDDLILEKDPDTKAVSKAVSLPADKK